MKRKYRFLKIVILSILLLFLMNFATNRHNHKKIDTINIEINQDHEVHFVTNDMVKKVVDISSENGKTERIKDLNIIKLERELDSIPYISKSNAFVNLDGKLFVTISQKTPIARIKAKRKEFYIDEEGKPLPMSSNFAYPCMLVMGDVSEQEYVGLMKLCKIITEDKLLKKHIIGITKDAENSFTLLINQQNYTIEFGDLQNSHQKLTNLKGFYQQYLNQVGLDTYKKLSLKYENQIVAVKK